MKKVVYNEEAAKIEKEKTKKAESEAKRREAYLRSLSGSPLFRKYVIKEIFEKRIAANSDIGNILKNNPIDIGKKSELGDLVSVCYLTAKELKIILREITG